MTGAKSTTLVNRVSSSEAVGAFRLKKVKILSRFCSVALLHLIIQNGISRYRLHRIIPLRYSIQPANYK